MLKYRKIAKNTEKYRKTTMDETGTPAGRIAVGGRKGGEGMDQLERCAELLMQCAENGAYTTVMDLVQITDALVNLYSIKKVPVKPMETTRERNCAICPVWCRAARSSKRQHCTLHGRNRPTVCRRSHRTWGRWNRRSPLP